jgi:hypothetical protein
MVPREAKKVPTSSQTTHKKIRVSGFLSGHRSDTLERVAMMMVLLALSLRYPNGG